MGTPRKSKAKESAGADTTARSKATSTPAARKKQPAAAPVSHPKAKAAPKVAAKGKTKPSPPAETTKKAAQTASKPAPAPKIVPRKPAVDEEMLKQLRDAMIHQRQRMLSVVRSTQAQLAEKTKDLPDVSDQASEGYGDELAVGLMAIEAAQLDDIEAALKRIDDGTYGLCLECGKPIPRKRLEVLPFVCRCLTCEGARELRVRAQAMYEEEEEP